MRTNDGLLTLAAHNSQPEAVPESSAYAPSFWSLDLLLQTISPTSSSVTVTEPSHGTLPVLHLSSGRGESWERFLQLALDSATNIVQGLMPLRFVFPFLSGTVCRSDFIPQRLECCELVGHAASFLEPLQIVEPVPVARRGDHDGASAVGPGLEQLLSKALGAIRLKPSASFTELDDEMRSRLSYPWLVPGPISRRRVAWIQGREDIDCIERALKAAGALGIALVVMDEPGHWLQAPNSPWAYLRESFVEIDLTADDGLAQRVVDAVRAYPEPIDGLVTISDVRLASIARACCMLGLPTEDPEAYDIAADKGATRMLEQAACGATESSVLASAAEYGPFMKQMHSSGSLKHMYPLVVKPVVGWCSDCVSKVSDDGELEVAVQKASARHASSAKPSTAVVVEPYVDGPEVDINFALLDGAVLFYEVNDDFPSSADLHDSGDLDSRANLNFQETQNVMPSALPAEEITAIRDQVLASILRMGFRTGVFHCEARVRNSHVKYERDHDGIFDLVRKPEHSDSDSDSDPDRLPLQALEVYLHEVNARPPGYLESVAVALTYGVDYYALRLLMAAGPAEHVRLRALSHPFLGGPQFHLSVMIIQQTQAGIMKSEDAAREFLDKHPQLKDHVVDYYTRKKAGDVLEGPDASALWWIAFLSVVSRTSRMDLLKRVKFVQEHFDYQVE
ncbi:hypothetical protein B0T19DRAFT_439126 [Cercophora scortea]|uniref:ATP-grasp domain-containing protein n=1 Tax=Cercophora scortea TaxID=314031 RepID=A0AAE0IVZ0_9PEZI|nr:hypothetical protein B0T19DRAFT_439126 [Cercophora scortea]